MNKIFIVLERLVWSTVKLLKGFSRLYHFYAQINKGHLRKAGGYSGWNAVFQLTTIRMRQQFEKSKQKLYGNGNQIEDIPTLMSTPEMVDSVYSLILNDRWVTIEEISERLRISLGTAHKIEHDDLAFFNVSCRCVSQEQRKNSENHESVYLGTAAQRPYSPDLALFDFYPI